MDICYISQLISFFFERTKLAEQQWGDRCPVSQPYFSLIPVGRAPKIQKTQLARGFTVTLTVSNQKLESGKAQTVGRHGNKARVTDGKTVCRELLQKEKHQAYK